MISKIFKNSKHSELQIIFHLFIFNSVRSDYRVNGKCGKPGLPPMASIWQISSDKSRFENNDKIIFICKKNEFPMHKQELICKNGRWVGTRPRCGNDFFFEKISNILKDIYNKNMHKYYVFICNIFIKKIII